MPTVEKPDTEMVPVQQAPISPMSLLQIAVSQGADIEKLTQLLALQERFEANEARKAFNAAMAEFKKSPPRIEKNKHVSYVNSKGDTTSYWHATIDNVCDKIIAALSAVDISHHWTVDQSEGTIAVTCWLTHISGHRQSTTLRAGPDGSAGKNPIQAVSSTVSYLERYTLLASVGLATEDMDDDGQSAVPSGGSMPEEFFVEHLNWINGCERSDELQKQFEAACDRAKKDDDRRAVKEFTKAMTGKILGWISGSEGNTLQVVYQRGYVMAQAVGDQAAMKQIVDAKDARKKVANAIR